METFMDMGNHIIGLGGQPWVSELLKLVRESPTHVFDSVLTTPSMVADILGDDAVTLLDIAYYRVNDDNRRHIQHVWYEAFVMKVTVWPLVQHVTMDCQLRFRGLPAIFQHNTEGGPFGLRAKLQEWWKLMRTRLSGTQWKVLVYGIAISWGEYNYYQERVGAGVCDHVLDVELRVLFDMLEDKGIDNFALVGLVVVYGVPADEKFEEQRRILSPEFTSNFRVLLLHKIAFESILVGGSFQGGTAPGEVYGLCKQLKAIREQLGWYEVDDDSVCGRKYFCNALLSIRVSWRPGPYGKVPIKVGMIVETNEDIESTGSENGYEGALRKGTWIEILCVGEEDDEVGYLFGKVCGSDVQLWLSFNSVREAGLQCPLDLEDVAVPPFPGS